jgi:hypothetical protein
LQAQARHIADNVNSVSMCNESYDANALTLQELLSDVERGTLRQRVSPTAVVLEEGELSRWRDSLAGLSGGLARVNEQVGRHRRFRC